jgi:hypothetical protein
MDIIILMISYFMIKKLNISQGQRGNIPAIKEIKMAGLDIFEINACR